MKYMAWLAIKCFFFFSRLSGVKREKGKYYQLDTLDEHYAYDIIYLGCKYDSVDIFLVLDYPFNVYALIVVQMSHIYNNHQFTERN